MVVSCIGFEDESKDSECQFSECIGWRELTEYPFEPRERIGCEEFLWPFNMNRMTSFLISFCSNKLKWVTLIERGFRIKFLYYNEYRRKLFRVFFDEIVHEIAAVWFYCKDVRPVSLWTIWFIEKTNRKSDEKSRHTYLHGDRVAGDHGRPFSRWQW